MATRPEQLGRGIPLILNPPFYLDGTRTFMFALPADRDTLQELLDTRFKWAQPDVVVTPLGAFVLCVFTSSPHARSSDPILGAQAYNEVTFFVPVIGTKGAVPFTGLHVPYIYPDSGIAVANGREIFGLPKKPANKVTVPLAADFVAGSPIEATTTGTATYAGALWTELQVVAAKTTSGGSPSTASTILGDLVALGMAPAFATIESIMKLHLLQTKEVADVDPNGIPKRELYRALTWTTTGTNAISNVQLLDSSSVKVNVADLASDPIRSDLGLAAGDITPIVSLSYTMDFFFGPAEVWKEVPAIGVTPPAKTRVLILGGGLGGLATALQLTSTEAYRNRFDVKIVAQGHRLGGKGSSWRSPDPRYSSRIEEHGIHVIFGFYHNFLRMLRGVYEDAERDPTTTFPARFSDAFSPRWDITFDDGTHKGFEFTFPKMPEDWGTGVPTPADFVKILSNMLYKLLDPTSLVKAIEDVFDDIKNLVLPKDWTNPIRKQLFEFTRILVQGTIAEIALSPKSFDDFDGIDFRAWMKKHGASDEILNGPVCQIPYDGVFAYAGPDTDHPLLGAGLAIRGLLRLAFFYETAPYFVMNAGMGEAVFAPIYEVLKSRGVEIDFFTKVTEIHVAGTVADKVVVQRQATVLSGPSTYNPIAPLTTTQGTIPTWTRDFDPAQLANPAVIAGKDFFSDAEPYFESTETFSLGADFDHVVCALPAPVTAKVLTGVSTNAELTAIANVKTVSTIQVQAWLDQKIEDLGWKFGGVALGGFMQPLDTFLECSRLLPAEVWPSATRPLGLLYACGPFTPAWGG
ncbi:MAG TPA: acetoacetate decarboxylase family protein, partial [Polyangiaceae bacterium]